MIACGHKPMPLSRNGLTVQRYVKRATGHKLKVEQVNDLIAIVELHCTRMPRETKCERCLEQR